MRSFDEIYQISAERHGGAEALEAKLGKPKSAAELAAIPEDRWLAEMSKYIFATGLNWTVIEKKWPGFEEAFHGFDLGRCAFMDDGMFDSLLQDTRIVRHGAKIQSVRDNAAFLLELREEGGVGEVLGGWPSDAFADLLKMLKKRGSRLGGMTGAYSMRMLARDSYLRRKCGEQSAGIQIVDESGSGGVQRVDGSIRPVPDRNQPGLGIEHGVARQVPYSFCDR